MSKSSVAFITLDKSDFDAAQKLFLPVYLYDANAGTADWHGLHKYGRVYYPAPSDYSSDTWQRMRETASAQGINATMLVLPTPSFTYFLEELYFTPHETIAELEKHIQEYSGESVRLQLAADKNTPPTNSSKVNDSNTTSPAKLAFNTMNDFYDLMVPDKKLTPAEIAVSGFIFRHVDWRTCEARIAITRIAEPMKKTDRYITTVLDSLVAKQVFAKSRGYGRTVNTYTPLLSDGSFMAGVDVNKFTISKK